MKNKLIVICTFALFFGPFANEAATADLNKMNAETVAAYQNGELQETLARALAAVEAGREMDDPPPEEFASSLNYLAYILDEGDKSEALWLEALDRLEAKDLQVSEVWFSVMFNLASQQAALGQHDPANARVFAAVSTARKTNWHGQAVQAASIHLFQNGFFVEASTLLQELLLIEPELLRSSYGDVYTEYSNAQENAEMQGNTSSALELIDGKIAILEQFVPDPEPAIRDLLYQEFSLHNSDENYAAAAKALTEWGAMGVPSDEEQTFVEDMARDMGVLVAHGFYSERRDAQIGQAKLAVAFAELSALENEPLLGNALRELAAAQANLGQITAAAATLRRALVELQKSEAGRLEQHNVLADLAANAWQRGDLTLAQDFFARSKAEYFEALSNGAVPLTDIDQAILATNEARVLVDSGQSETALLLLESAENSFQAARSASELKWNQEAVGVKIEMALALAQNELGAQSEALEHVRNAVRASRQFLGADHPELALNLTNAADTLLVLGKSKEAEILLRDAVSINHTALPASTPQVIETDLKLALLQLQAGNRGGAAELLRKVAKARTSPVYRDQLPNVASDFEIFAWVLLDSASGLPDVDYKAADEAFQALQWTQVARSAQAVASMESRLSSANPDIAALLRRRQDLAEQHGQNISTLLAAVANLEWDRAALERLNARQNLIETDLAAVEVALVERGLETSGIGTVQALTIEDAQKELGPDEALVTFLLPSLKPGALPGLDRSSNRTIAITHDNVRIAEIPEISRGNLNQRIGAFRCQVAIGDPDCAGTALAASRGAMVAPTDEADPAGLPFDSDLAFGLYRDLFGGVEDLVADKTHLIIVPPSDLLRLPFQALVTNNGDRTALADINWIIRRHAISVLPSVSGLRTLRQPGRVKRNGPKHFLGIGDPEVGVGGPANCNDAQYASLRSAPAGIGMTPAPDQTGMTYANVSEIAALDRLPESACELNEIARVFGDDNSRLILGGEARETGIKDLDASRELESFDVLVFATHGLMVGEAGTASPGLVLTPPEIASAQDDGLLTAAEISTFTLNADLVVLSACNTAAGESGDAEGLSGLARAFLYAGARSLMVTHWYVLSEAAVEMSTSFFTATQDFPDEGYSLSLQRAVLGIIDDPNAEPSKLHPSYWASFAIIGAG